MTVKKTITVLTALIALPLSACSSQNHASTTPQATPQTTTEQNAATTPDSGSVHSPEQTPTPLPQATQSTIERQIRGEIAITETLTPPATDIANEAYENPTNGGIEQAKLMSVAGGFKPITSYIEPVNQMDLEPQSGEMYQFGAVCKTEGATFYLLRNGKTFGEGPCGPGHFTIMTTNPYFPTEEAPTYSFKIVGSDKFEVAVYSRLASD